MSLRYACVLILAVACSACAVRPIDPEDRDFISRNAAVMAQAKSESEQWARRIKSRFQPGSATYEGAYSRYIPAKAAIDKWIDRVAIDLGNRNKLDSRQYQAILDDVSAKSGEFIEFSSRIAFDAAPPLAPPAAPPVSASDVAKGLVNLGFNIWDRYRDASKDQTEGLTKSLEALRWKPFDDL